MKDVAGSCGEPFAEPGLGLGLGLGLDRRSINTSHFASGWVGGGYNSPHFACRRTGSGSCGAEQTVCLRLGTHRRFMMTRPRHPMTATICMLAAALTLGGAGQLDAVVVCVGPDGHIDVESFLDGCCTSATAGDKDGGAGPTLAGSACGDCADVQLTKPPLRTKRSHLSQPDHDAGCIPCSLCVGGGSRAPSADAADRIDQHWRSLVPLSSIVLLT